MPDTPVVLILFGTRPEAIKLAPVFRALAGRSEAVELRVVSTGQHDELLEDALGSFDMEVEESLAIMRPDQDLYDIGVGCLEGLRATLRRVKPDVVVVEGDTATVFFGALAGFYEGAEVAHVEAGLRSGDRRAPFPEEIYRRLTDVLTDHYFAPTAGAKRNLLREGVAAERVNVTGNTVIDAVQALAGQRRPIDNAELKRCIESGRRLVLITAHRRESFGEPIREAFGALRTLAEEHPDDLFVYPVHPNPNVRQPAQEMLGGVSNVRLLEPLSYSDLVQVLSAAWITITDSGGIQEEAPSFGVPVLVMREVTERPEGVELGVAELVGTSRDRILERGGALLDDDGERARMATAGNPYGDGQAGARIADILLHRILGTRRLTEDWA
ncbi:MAG: UDP-N-acetylglucosamine 2-epimerase (non-hydrolyzing) [Gemmatimonadetes bacterium]|uniref:UDP-N-acetylglucosamine 2-epimerase (non-hydrolyzing) n=1 Tax=Candidatus Kutchimonas denitrificans TaxID=3056748 RepID=A0AAE4Z7T4_9BACT|nr:UDP-N-acetylglucosamine 2-epimerase (non-hydrolyzing) [Gemmatimonadota bacterium]NIR75248.1 UDP-N-acetylglucosamine 2-epimerase (non-hydrolyzing) [Candidatus Kutchimonas denitrificans]NIS00186.1 UDP-N-acetylglucosamine 2-epimerase (non-hydrolyzing) [Gemmatimonadota bacterium]NIT65778.1 UDP-N-acetylglucosamine 2-epimerase (non-hydrolyzing) [Gemmatimonadota bacterium]NIU53056.1 UDP-N-acetylglucosamine 2-epimerase (non-hydrolyzing) [Gemmatimonadota bacterium]